MESNQDLEKITLRHSGKGTFSEALQAADNAKLRLPTPYEAIAYGRSNPEDTQTQNMWTRAVGITQHGGGIDSRLCERGKAATLQVGIYCLNGSKHSRIIREMIEEGKYTFPIDPNCDISRARAEIGEKVAYVKLNSRNTDSTVFISLFRDKATDAVTYFTNEQGPYFPHVSLEGVSGDIGTARIIPATINTTAKQNIITFHDEIQDPNTKKITRPNAIANIYLVKKVEKIKN